MTDSQPETPVTMAPFPVHVVTDRSGRVARFGGPDTSVFIVANQVAAIRDIPGSELNLDGKMMDAVEVQLIGGGKVVLDGWAVPTGGAGAVAQVLFGEQHATVAFGGAPS